MKTQLQKELAQIAPSICIETIWEHDPDLHDIRKDCDGMEDEDPADWQAWQSEIRATAIQAGEEVTGSAYLGGTWEKAGDNPATSNPNISGYEPQMTVEALTELLAITSILGRATRNQINEAIIHVERMMQVEWKAQQQPVTA
jgi:hypothetical protein